MLISNSSNEIILITAVDEIFPIISIEKMYEKIKLEDYDLRSRTLYSKGCARLGEKFINGWVKYGVEKGKIDRDNVKEIYGWIKILEDCDLNNLKEELDGN